MKILLVEEAVIVFLCIKKIDICMWLIFQTLEKGKTEFGFETNEEQ